MAVYVSLLPTTSSVKAALDDLIKQQKRRLRETCVILKGQISDPRVILLCELGKNPSGSGGREQMWWARRPAGSGFRRRGGGWWTYTYLPARWSSRPQEWDGRLEDIPATSDLCTAGDHGADRDAGGRAMVPTKDAPPLPKIGVVDEKQEIGEQMRPINEKGRSIILSRLPLPMDG